MKALFLHHPYVRPRFEQEFLDRLNELAEFHLERADLPALAEGRLATASGDLDFAGYDAVLVYVAFPTALRKAAPLHWGGYTGLRVLVEHDAIQNYSDIFDPALKGAWPPVFRRHNFDLMITSGGVVRDRLIAEGIEADWLPKAMEPSRFADLDGPRAGLVTYGSQYRCRVVAERAIYAAGLPLERMAPPYLELGAALARYLACMAVSSDLLVPLRLRPLLRWAPPRVVPIRPGLEPMAKLFEGAGAGCCPVADDMADLGPLGFVDGETAITFRSHGDLVDRLRWWFDRPGQLRELGRAAARLAHARHTWAHRAIELRDIIARRLVGRSA